MTTLEQKLRRVIKSVDCILQDIETPGESKGDLQQILVSSYTALNAHMRSQKAERKAQYAALGTFSHVTPRPTPLMLGVPA